jgi:hypothetical protein
MLPINVYKNIQVQCTTYFFVIKHYDSRLLSFVERARGKKHFLKRRNPLSLIRLCIQSYG